MKYYQICFSPTGGTQKVADILATEWMDEIVKVDLTDCKNRFYRLQAHERGCGSDCGAVL